MIPKVKKNILNIFFYILLGLFLIIIFVIFISILTKKNNSKKIDPDILSKKSNLKYYNPKGKMFEFSSEKELRVKDSKIQRIKMNTVNIKLNKKGDFDKDLTISSKSGYRERGDKDFFLQGNCKISAKDFLLKSNEFNLKNRNMLHTSKKTDVKVNSLQGLAKTGIRYNIKNGALRLFKFRGKILEDNKNYHFSTKSLLMIDKHENERSFLLEGKATVSEKDSNLKAEIIKIDFWDKFKTPQKVNAKNKVDFLLYKLSGEKQESMRVRGNQQLLEYNKDGKLTKLTAIGKASILLKNENNLSRTNCKIAIIQFNTDTGKISSISLKENSRVDNKGKKDFNLKSENIQIIYDKSGEIISCKGHQNCIFEIDDFKSHSDLLEYLIPKNVFWIRTNSKDEDDTVTLETKSNSFSSQFFKVNTDKKLLSSSSNIKSLIKFEKENLLFKTTPVTILSKSVNLNNETNEIIYQGKVKIFQDQTLFLAETVKISNNLNIFAEKEINIQFPGKDGLITLKSQKLIYNQDKFLLNLSKDANLKQNKNTLTATTITIAVSLKNQIETIEAKDPENIIFKKETVSGTSKNLLWIFEKSIVKFLNSASISKNEFITKAEEIQLNLENDNITILSKNQDRTETVIN